MHDDPDNMDLDDQDRDHLYSVTFEVSAREFKNQSSSPPLPSITISGDSVQDFKHHIWLELKPHLKREVVPTGTGKFARDFDFSEFQQ